MFLPIPGQSRSQKLGEPIVKTNSVSFHGDSKKIFSSYNIFQIRGFPKVTDLKMHLTFPWQLQDPLVGGNMSENTYLGR